MEGITQTQQELMFALPGKARQLRTASLLGNPDGEATGENEFHVYVALWSAITDQAEGWVLSTASDWFSKGYRPFTWKPVEQLHTPPPAEPPDPAKFRPFRDGRRLLEEQRQHPQFGGNVGGFGEVATVRRNAVTVDRVVTWPDVVGELQVI